MGVLCTIIIIVDVLSAELILRDLNIMAYLSHRGGRKSRMFSIWLMPWSSVSVSNTYLFMSVKTLNVPGHIYRNYT